MELPFLSSFPIFFSLLLFVVMVMKLKSKSKSPNPKLPPGPWKLPIIGNIHQMIGDLPHRTLRHLSSIHGPLMHLQLGELSIVVISSPEMAKEVLKTRDLNFASRPRILAMDLMSYNYTDLAFAPYGDYWRRLRKICTSELLTVARVKSYRRVREEEVSDFIKSLSLGAGKPVNLSNEISLLASGIISRAAFGKKSEENDLFISITQETIKLSGGFSVADLFPSIEFLRAITGVKAKLEDMHRKADKIHENIINEHKLRVKSSSSGEAAVEDLVDVLLKYTDGADVEFPLTTDNIKAVILDVFGGGTDTSTATIEWAMAEMIKKPSVMAKAQAEVRQVFDVKGEVDETDFRKLNYFNLVLKETLRLHPPGPLLVPRECRERCEINGYEIPLKTNVMVNVWAIGRDPNYWDDPDTFNPERFVDCSTDYKGNSFEFLPFGSGRRMCPGLAFGMAQIELALAALLYHFDWKLPDGMKAEDFDMSETFGGAVKRKHDLLLIPLARS